MNVLLYPKGGMSIAWTYTDREGTQECKLVGVNQRASSGQRVRLNGAGSAAFSRFGGRTEN